MKPIPDQALVSDRTSKILDLETAMKYFRKAGGDKNMAREAALKDGWTIPNVAGEEVRCRIDGRDYIKARGRWYQV